MLKARMLTVVAAALVALPASAQTVVNGDFEAGNTGFTSDYDYVASPGPYAMYGEGTYTVGGNAADYHNLWADVSAYQGSSYFIGNGDPAANGTVWAQTVTGLTVGKGYRFSAYVTNVCCNDRFGGPNGTPVLVAVNGGTLNTSVSATETGKWVRLAGTFVAKDKSTDLRIINDNTMRSGNDFGLDAIAVSAAPEPATWALMIMGFGAVGGAMRRRSTRVAFAA